LELAIIVVAMLLLFWGFCGREFLDDWMLVIIMDEGGGRTKSRKKRREVSHLTMLRGLQNFLYDDIFCTRDVFGWLPPE